MELVERLRSEAEADEGLFLTRSAKLKHEAADLLEEALKALRFIHEFCDDKLKGTDDWFDLTVIRMATGEVLTKSQGEKIDG